MFSSLLLCCSGNLVKYKESDIIDQFLTWLKKKQIKQQCVLSLAAF